MEQEAFEYLKELEKKIEQHTRGLNIGTRLSHIKLFYMDGDDVYTEGAELTDSKNKKLFKDLQRILIDHSSSRLLKYQKEFDEIN